MGKIYEDLTAEEFAANTEGLVFSDYNSEYSHPYRVFHPSAMSLGVQDVDLDSGRTTDGTMQRYRKGTKRMLSLTFPYMSTKEVAAVLRALSTFGHVGVKEGSEAFFHVTYTDPLEGTEDNNYRVTKVFYSGDRITPCYSEVLGLWEELTADIVER